MEVLRELNQEPYNYALHYYTKESKLQTYEAIIYPLPKKVTWNIPSDISNIVELPPQGRIRAGRLKKRRCKAPWEVKAQNKCARCGIYGHNRKTCRNPPKIQ